MKMFFFNKVTGYSYFFSRPLPLAASVSTKQRVILAFILRDMRKNSVLRFTLLLSDRRNIRTLLKMFHTISHARGQHHIENSKFFFNIGVEPDIPLLKFYCK